MIVFVSTRRGVLHTMAAPMLLMTGRGDLELFDMTAQLFNCCTGAILLQFFVTSDVVG